MKIRKFNEDKNSELMEYISECFVEFSDMGYNFEQDLEVYSITIPIYKYTNDEGNDEEFVNMLEKTYNMGLSLQVCIEKVKSKFPGIYYTMSFGYEGDTTNIDLWFEIDKKLWV
jgi:hypothetical protein